jgi:drug/metabolite transporter (DMT)-like permease
LCLTCGMGQSDIMMEISKPALRENGILLALLGAFILAPDALFMRLSELSGPHMLFWRGLFSGAVYLATWAFVARPSLAQVLDALKSKKFWVLVGFQVANSTGFSIGIAHAPVTSVLLGVATVPLMAALLSALFLKEKISRRTCMTICFVMAGLGLAITDQSEGQLAFNKDTLFGALCGLSVAISLAANFVIVRKNKKLPFPLGMGLGSLLAGLLGLYLANTSPFSDLESVAIIIFTGAIILPCSLFLLTWSSRHTTASNVSLIMLLETVLGSIWVWVFLGERPTAFMMAGGALVLVTLALYLRAGNSPTKTNPVSQHLAP